jgi:hypothetical protein
VSNLRQAFNAGVVGFWGAEAVRDVHAHHPEAVLLDIGCCAVALLVLRHIKQKPSP